MLGCCHIDGDIAGLSEGKLRVLQFMAASWLAFTCVLAPAHAEKRIALVIGNDRYANLSDREQLLKAVNDAQAVGNALKQIGFDVISGENLGRQPMIDKLDETARRLSAGDTVFFFFAGHGVAVDNVNYVLPADVPDVDKGQVTRLTGAAIREDDITSALMRSGARVAVVVLDACRDNPFGSGTRGIGGERGLAPHEPVSGVFTLYSASRGQAALDRLSGDDGNPNSVFTRVLAPALTRPGLDLPGLAVSVREEVMRIASSAGRQQRPAYYDETVGGQIYLAGLPPAAADGSGGVSTTLPAPRLAPAREPAACGAAAVTPAWSIRTPQALSHSEECALKPKDAFKECEKCPEMVVIPEGSFMMGSPATEEGRAANEGPQTPVTFARAFAAGKFAVTFDEWDACVGGGGCSQAADDGRPRGRNPVVNVSWDDVQAYVAWLASTTGKPYRLLSEAEREYVARAGTTTPFWWGASISTDQANYDGTAEPYGGEKGIFRQAAQPVDRFAANPFGLYQVHGNVSEWVSDCWRNAYPGTAANGAAWTAANCGAHVVRGGSWFDAPQKLRSAARSEFYSAFRAKTIGFRIARPLQGGG
jgi:formylglycine-generating enzyme required for sulfatase activity